MTANQEKYRQERLDPRWQKKRLLIMERDGFKCRDCGDDKATLNVHHAYYVTGRKCWNYPSFSLETLCKHCHEQRHLPPDESEREHFSEWEQAIDWITGEVPENGMLWEVAAEVAQASRYTDRKLVLKSIEKFINKARTRAALLQNA